MTQRHSVRFDIGSVGFALTPDEARDVIGRITEALGAAGELEGAVMKYDRPTADEMARLSATATPGPWWPGNCAVHTAKASIADTWVDRPNGVTESQAIANAAFIAAARTYIPDSLARLTARRS